MKELKMKESNELKDEKNLDGRMFAYEKSFSSGSYGCRKLTKSKVGVPLFV